jgi:hypothetical protein
VDGGADGRAAREEDAKTQRPSAAGVVHAVLASPSAVRIGRCYLWHESDGNFRVAQSIADHFEALLGKARRCGRALMV